MEQLDRISPEIQRPEIEIDKKERPSSKDGLSNIFKKTNRYEWSDRLGFTGGPHHRRKGRGLIAFSWAASLIDGLLVIALSFVLLAATSMSLKYFNPELLKTFQSAQGSFFWLSVFAGTSWLYQVSFRIFLGYTLGEWTYDLRLGSPSQRLSLSYGYKVLIRSSLVIGSGFILFPILSFALGKDVLGIICRLKIFSLR